MAVSFTVFNAPGAVGTLATSINNRGEVAGNFTDASQNTRGFLRHRDGNIIVFDTPTASGTAVFFSGVEINIHGDVTGDFADKSQGKIRCFVRHHGGNLTAFDVPNESLQYAQGINDGGEIVGYFQDASQGGKTRGFLRHRNGNIVVFDAPDATFTTATSINNHGHIAGQFGETSQSSQDRGFVRHQNGNFTAFDVPNALNLFVESINDGGDVVGGFQDTSQGGKTRGFVRDRAGNITIFDAPNASTAAGGGTRVTSINDPGEIAGYVQDASQGNKGRGFVRDRNGSIAVFDAPNASTVVGQGTWTAGISDDGDIVGSFQDASQGKTRGFVRSR
jgi:probable HAF family extracellular repeat protein